LREFGFVTEHAGPPGVRVFGQLTISLSLSALA
jgi:hypothetical protein